MAVAKWGESGRSLTELIIVVAILTLVAAVAAPNLSSNNEQRLDLAADEFAAAIRFARTEAIRTGQPHGFKHESSEPRIRVFRADTVTSPATIVYDVYHPIDKQIYDVQLDDQSVPAVDTIVRTTLFRGTCSDEGAIYFDANGTSWCHDPETVLLDSFDLTLHLGPNSRTITVSGIAGRVTAQ